MNIPLKISALGAAFALSMGSAHALKVLHVANTDSADYSAFIEAEYPGSTWVHKPSGLTANETVGGDLDRTGTFGGTAGITLKSYLQSFDLIIVGNNVSSGNFGHATAAADWAALTKPVLFDASLATRETGGRPGLFSGDNNVTVTFDTPSETVRVATTPLADAIFSGASPGTDLYDSALFSSTESISTAAAIGGGQVISNITGTVGGVAGSTVRGIVFWNAGAANGSATANIQAANRAFFPMRNAVNSSSFLTADGKIVLGNLIGELLVTPALIAPSALTATPAPNAINLAWSGSAGAVSYNVKRSHTAGGPYTTISTAGAVTGTTFTDNTGTNGLTYYYVVTAVDAQATESGVSNEASATVTAILAPTAVTATSGMNQIQLSWTASTGAVSYKVKRSEISGGPYTEISTPGSVTGTTYIDTAVTNEITYYYVVAAVDGSANVSPDSNQASAVAVPVIQPAIDILYVSNSNNADYQAFATSGQFANNTWTQKATGTGNQQVGGDLNRSVDFTGTNGGTGIVLKDYLQSFDLVIIGVPTSSSNFIDASMGADWANITTPVLVHANTVARSLGGRTGLFSQDNFVTFTLGNPDDTKRVSTSALADAILAGVAAETDLYSLTQSDTILNTALYGSGERITDLTDGTVDQFGIVFWATGDITATGNTLAANRAFLPLKGGFNDLTANGKKVVGNLINQIQLAQTTAGNPYGEWAAYNIGALNPAAAPGFTADPDNDGLANGLEWILGGDPLLADRADLYEVAAADSTNGLTLIFNIPSSESLATGKLSVEWDTDLDAFAHEIVIGTSDVGPNGTEPTVDVGAPTAGKVTVNIPAANATAGRIFARLKGAVAP